MGNARALVRALFFATVTLFASVPAEGQDAATVAEALFKEGIDAMKAGDTNTACEKFAESQRLDASSGTLLNLANCHEKQGKIATAWAEFLAAGRLAKSQGRTERADEAKKRAADLEPKLSRLKIVLTEKVPGLSVKIDSLALEAGALSSKIPVDPGERTVTISAPGYKALALTVQIGAERDSQTLNVPKLEKDASAGAAPTGTDTPPAATSTTEPPPTPDKPSTKPGPPIAGYVIGGVGVVALGVGSVFAFMARSAYDDADSACPTHTGCSSDAISTRDKAESRANIANIGIGLGLVGIGVGTFIVLTSSRGSAETSSTRKRNSVRVTPYVSPSQAGVALTGVTF